MRTLPHLCASNRFQDKERRWWSTYFVTGPWDFSVGIVAMKVRAEGEDVIIEVEENPTDHQKRVMGGGKIADVKTVPQTLSER